MVNNIEHDNIHEMIIIMKLLSVHTLSLSPIWLKWHFALCLCCFTLILYHSSPFSPFSPPLFNSLTEPLASSPVSLSLSLPSLHTTESCLAQSPPPSLGSACRRPTPTTSEASGWLWPHPLASRASLDSHLPRCDSSSSGGGGPLRCEVRGVGVGGKWKRGLECFLPSQSVVF